MARQPIDRRVPRARRLRHDTTDAERKLWPHLKQMECGATHFRRQATVGPYFADFACHKLRLVIEIDGGQHESSKTDAARTGYLESQGYRVLRFWNNDVLNNVAGVAEVIARAVAKRCPPTPDPSPPQAAGGGETNPRDEN